MSTTRALQLFQLLRQGAVLLTSVLLAKSGLSTAEIGAYEMLLYLGAVATFFWVNGLLQAMPPVYGKLPETDRPAFFFNNFLVFSALAILVFLALFFGRAWALPALTGFPDLPNYELFCWYLLLSLPAFPVEYVYLLRKKAWQIVGWGVFSFGAQLLVVGLPLWLGYGIRASFWGLVALGGARWLWTAGLVLRVGRAVWRPDLIRRYLTFAGPLMLNVVVGNLILLFDSWLVGWWYRDEAVFAVFRYGAREFPLVQALAGALGVAIIPRLIEDFQAGLTDLRAMSRKLFHLLFPAAILLIFLAKPLFPVIFNPDFAAAAPLFNIYLLMTASRLLLPNSIVLAKGEPRVILWVGAAEFAAKVVFGLLGICYWGLAGLAWSAVLAFWVEKILLIIYLRKQHGLALRDWLDARWFGAYCLLLLAAYAGSLCL
jgi:O-antigen/teichoic acid export membrane protein